MQEVIEKIFYYYVHWLVILQNRRSCGVLGKSCFGVPVYRYLRNMGLRQKKERWGEVPFFFIFPSSLFWRFAQFNFSLITTQEPPNQIFPKLHTHACFVGYWLVWGLLRSIFWYSPTACHTPLNMQNTCFLWKQLFFCLYFLKKSPVY